MRCEVEIRVFFLRFALLCFGLLAGEVLSGVTGFYFDGFFGF